MRCLNFRVLSSSSSSSVLAQKLDLVPGSLEHGLAIESQAKLEADPNAAATLFLHAAGVLSKHSSVHSLRARHSGAVSLLHAGRAQEALHELRTNLRLSGAGVDMAMARVSVGLAEVIVGNKSGGIDLLQESMHQLHKELGRAHPLSHKVQKLWSVAELQEEDLSHLIKHV